MCRLLMSWYVLQYQAICNHIIDSFSVTQDAEFIIIDLTTVWKGKKIQGHWLNSLISLLSQTSALVYLSRL